MLARKVVNLDWFVHKYTSTVIFSVLPHSKFFVLWTTGLGILV